jgi:hypothetical protein
MKMEDDFPNGRGEIVAGRQSADIHGPFVRVVGVGIRTQPPRQAAVDEGSRHDLALDTTIGRSRVHGRIGPGRH